MLNNVSSDKKFLKILKKKSDENSIRTSEIFCDFEKILSRFWRIYGKLFKKRYANFGEISKNLKKLIELSKILWKIRNFFKLKNIKKFGRN